MICVWFSLVYGFSQVQISDVCAKRYQVAILAGSVITCLSKCSSQMSGRFKLDKLEF